MIQINFNNKTILYTCTHFENGVNKGCGKQKIVSFEQLKNQKNQIYCDPCPNDVHDWKVCTHCPISESCNLTCFVQNLELHPFEKETGKKAKDHQADQGIWETNRSYHILRRMLEHGKEYEEVKDEPDLYEKAHETLDHQTFKRAWREHEMGIKHISEYLK